MQPRQWLRFRQSLHPAQRGPGGSGDAVSSQPFENSLPVELPHAQAGNDVHDPVQTHLPAGQMLRKSRMNQQQEKGEMPQNFMRHYYDISQLLDHPDVTAFIGIPEYHARKEVRFRAGDNLNISENEAFLLSDPATREQYALAYQATASLYYDDQVPFDVVLEKIQSQIEKL